MNARIRVPLTVCVLLLSACGGDTRVMPQTGPTAVTDPPTPSFGPVPDAPTIESVSPSTARIGSADVTITIKGKNFEDGTTSMFSSGVTWTVGQTDTYLLTTFVDHGELKAVIPAGLMLLKTAAKVTVQDWRGADDMPSATSNAIDFTVN